MHSAFDMCQVHSQPPMDSTTDFLRQLVRAGHRLSGSHNVFSRQMSARCHTS